MKVYHLIVDAQIVLDTFSPVELVETIMQHCKGKGERPIDVYTTDVK